MPLRYCTYCTVIVNVSVAVSDPYEPDPAFHFDAAPDPDLDPTGHTRKVKNAVISYRYITVVDVGVVFHAYHLRLYLLIRSSKVWLYVISVDVDVLHRCRCSSQVYMYV